jgi:hypothetical protein
MPVSNFEHKLANTTEIKALIHDYNAKPTSACISTPVSRESQVQEQPNLT